MYRGLCGYWKKEVLKHSNQIIEQIKPDAIIASYPSIEALEIGVGLAKKYGLPLISDFRDGLIFEPLDIDVTRRKVVQRYYQKIEAQVVAVSKLIITVSEPISSYFSKQYAHLNVMTLPNGFDKDDVGANSDIPFAPYIINIVHTGRIELSRKESSGKGKGVDALCASLFLLLQRFPKLADEMNIHFVGALSRTEKKCLLPFIKLGIVKLWGHQPRARAIDFQRKADVLLIITAPDKPSIATGKIFEYLAANKPILALTRGTAAEKIVWETGAGGVVSPDNPKEIASALETILQKNGDGFMKRNDEAIMAFSRDKQINLLSSKIKEFKNELSQNL